MSLISVQVSFKGAALAAGVSVASEAIQVTDASGAVQNTTLNGSESPPWSTSFTVAAGKGNVTATETDSDGTVQPTLTVAYDTSVTAQNLMSDSVAVTIVTP
jgi:hypothetical protein